MMSKEGKELVISQVFPLQAQTAGLDVGKAQSLLHLDFNLNVILSGQKKGQRGMVQVTICKALLSVVPRPDNLGKFTAMFSLFTEFH